MAKLTLTINVQEPDKAAREVAMTTDLVRIGASEPCEIRLAGPGVQALHAQIRRSPEGFVLEPVPPVPGLQVNKGVFKDKILKTGDVLAIGSISVAFTVSAPVAQSIARNEKQGQGELQLLMHSPLRGQTEYVMAKEEIIIGRSMECDVCLDEAGVVPRHASIKRTPTGYVLSRLPGPATLKVNGELADQRVIYHGDEIQIGQTRIQVNSLRRAFKTMADLVYSRGGDAPEGGTGGGKGEGGRPTKPEARVDTPQPDDAPVVLDKREAFRSVLGFDVPHEGEHESILKMLEDPPPVPAAPESPSAPATPQPAQPRAEPPADAAAARPDILAQLFEPVGVDQSSSWLGGMWNFKTWVTNGQRILAHTRGLVAPFPRAVSLVGLPGAGKRLAARAISLLWGLPLVRFRLDLLLAQPPSQWTSTFLSAMNRSQAQPAILVLFGDVDRAVSSVYGNDEAAQQRVVDFYNQFVACFRGRRKGQFTIFTASDTRWCHQELLQRGAAVDEVFFIDLPNEQARGEVLWVSLSLAKLPPDRFDLTRLASAARGLVAGEIDRAVQEGVRVSAEAKRPCMTEDILEALSKVRPVVESAQYFADLQSRARVFSTLA